ncbi:hypothetical protein [Corynebacterium sp. A21]|uniref:hypothetical protein n=1 Tax=Corynebacterium sp. A21 TaxID=3457318 RepID=UPI003FD2ABCC
MSRRSTEWLLIEFFGHENQPTVIGRAGTAKGFVPLDAVIKSATHRAVVASAIESIKDGATSRKDFTQGETRYIFIPLSDWAGHTQGVLVHYSDSSTPVKAHPACGAWHFNASTGEASGSPELSDIYRTPEQERGPGKSRPIHEAFERLVGNDPVAIRKLIDKRPGVTHQASETVLCDDGTWRVIHYSCRFVEQENGEIILRGITRQVGSYEPGSGQSPNPFDLANQVAAAEHQPNIYRAIIDPTTGNLLHSYDPYPSHLVDIRNIRDATNDQDQIDMIMSLLHLCAQDRVPVHNLFASGTEGQRIDFELLPIEVDGSTAVFGRFKLSPE